MALGFQRTSPTVFLRLLDSRQLACRAGTQVTGDYRLMHAFVVRKGTTQDEGERWMWRKDGRWHVDKIKPEERGELWTNPS